MQSSGRHGFDQLVFNHKAELPKVNTVKSMLKRENELRLSKEFQTLIDGHNQASAEPLYEALQKQVAREFGYKSEIEQELGRDIIRCAATLYKDDSEIKEIPLYIKYNRAEQGVLKIGDDCPDVTMSGLNGCAVKLSDFTKTSLPLVLVAGSYTWPPFKGAVPILHQFQHTCNKRAEFLAVYITEAHAKDEWPVGETVSVCNQPKSMDERLAIANQFVKDHDYKVPLIVDTMNNSFQKMFAAWPIRFYIVRNGKIVYKAQPDLESYTYNIDEVEAWLNTNA